MGPREGEDEGVGNGREFKLYIRVKRVAWRAWGRLREGGRGATWGSAAHRLLT